jgi:hypothetical protein
MPCYRAKTDHTSTMNDKPGVGSNWQTRWEECDCTPSCSSATTPSSSHSATTPSPSPSPSSSPSAQSSTTSSSSVGSSSTADPAVTRNFYFAYICPPSGAYPTGMPTSAANWYTLLQDNNYNTLGSTGACDWANAIAATPIYVDSLDDAGALTSVTQNQANCVIQYKFVQVEASGLLAAGTFGSAAKCVLLIKAFQNLQGLGLTTDANQTCHVATGGSLGTVSFMKVNYISGDSNNDSFTDCTYCMVF